jgi:hypothetical protein
MCKGVLGQPLGEMVYPACCSISSWCMYCCLAARPSLKNIPELLPFPLPLQTCCLVVIFRFPRSIYAKSWTKWKTVQMISSGAPLKQVRQARRVNTNFRSHPTSAGQGRATLQPSEGGTATLQTSVVCSLLLAHLTCLTTIPQSIIQFLKQFISKTISSWA